MSTNTTLEHCTECDQPTGNAGRDDDSIFIAYPDKEVGPLCAECSELYWICDKCGEGVYPLNVTFNEKHEGCGGNRA